MYAVLEEGISFAKEARWPCCSRCSVNEMMSISQDEKVSLVIPAEGSSDLNFEAMRHFMRYLRWTNGITWPKEECPFRSLPTALPTHLTLM